MRIFTLFGLLAWLASSARPESEADSEPVGASDTWASSSVHDDGKQMRLKRSAALAESLNVDTPPAETASESTDSPQPNTGEAAEVDDAAKKTGRTTNDPCC
jgi:hypothetical protein